jgi:uncharacterized protein YqgC (DUF456 family)
METALLALASVFTIVGVAGNLLPAVPGTPLNYIALLALHYTRGDVFSTTFLVAFGVLTVLSLAVDYLVPLLGARLYGVTRYGMAGFVIGMFVGFLTLSLPGMVLGMVTGAVVGELYAGKNRTEALRSGIASFAGSIAAFIFKLGLSFVMVFSFFYKLLSG